MKPRILVHGGADTALEGTAKKGVIRAASTGIKYTDSALDMVQEAIKVLEDDGSFGAGAHVASRLKGNAVVRTATTHRPIAPPLDPVSRIDTTVTTVNAVIVSLTGRDALNRRASKIGSIVSSA